MTSRRPVLRWRNTVGVSVIIGVLGLLAACGHGSDGLPGYTPSADPTTATASTSSAPSATARASTTSSSPTARTSTTAAGPSLTIDLGRFASDPAAQGFATAYRQFYSDLVQGKVSHIRQSYYPTFVEDIDTDVGHGSQSFLHAIDVGGFRMPHHGSLTVVSVSQVVGIAKNYSISFCRSPRTQPYSASRRQYFGLNPGQTQTIGFSDNVTVTTGYGGQWFLLAEQGSPKSCAGVRYKA